MTRFVPFVLLLVFALAPIRAADPLYESADRKLDLIATGRARPGSTIAFTVAEINAWARVAVPNAVPQGIRDERVELGSGTGSAYALVDFLKMRQGKGQESGWLLTKMLEGERPLKISIRLESGGGRCTVYLTQVELSGAIANGDLLDFLIRAFFTPLYPTAKINEPFDLAYNVDRIEIRPDAVRVIMKKTYASR